MPIQPGVELAQHDRVHPMHLDALGFEREGVAPIHFSDASFTLEEAQASLFASTVWRPVSVTLDDGGEGPQQRVVIIYAKAVYTSRGIDNGWYDKPDWLLEGVLYKGEGKLNPVLMKVRVFAATFRGCDDFTAMAWQFIV